MQRIQFGWRGSQIGSFLLSKSRLKSFSCFCMQPHLLEVCVVGDFKIDDLKTVVKKYIGETHTVLFACISHTEGYSLSYSLSLSFSLFPPGVSSCRVLSVRERRRSPGEWCSLGEMKNSSLSLLFSVRVHRAYLLSDFAFFAIFLSFVYLL